MRTALCALHLHLATVPHPPLKPSSCLPPRSPDFIRASPLLPSCGISGAQVEADAGRWVELGGRVMANLGLPPLAQLAAEDK